MNLNGIVNAANNLADESFGSSQLVEFVNDAIAEINISCSANFPFINIGDSEEYAGFPEKWQRALFIPFVVGRMKAVDSSQFEYNDNYSAFVNNLALFKQKYTIPEEYKDTSEVTRYETDFSSNYWRWG